MSFLKFLKHFLCCFFPKMRKTRIVVQEIPNLLCNKKSYKRHRRRRSSKDTVEALANIRMQSNYHDLKKKIMNKISFDSTSTIIVWCPENMVPNDYISTMLHKYGKITRFLDRWIKKDSILARGTWAGAVVQYAKRVDADFAVKDLSIRCKDIKILALHQFLPVLAECEMIHLSNKESSFKVRITSRKSLDFKDSSSLYLQLFTYGQVHAFRTKTHYSTGVICEVTYPYLTHAYLAAVMTEGLIFGRTVLFTSILENERKEEILADVRNYFMVAMDSCLSCHFL